MRQDVGLPLAADWAEFKAVLKQALEGLHDSFQLLSQNRLIDEFALVAPGADDWTRAQALTSALEAAVESLRLPGQAGGGPFFALLSESYGLAGDAQQRFEGGVRPTAAALCQQLGLSRSAYFGRRDEALEALARAFRRRFSMS